MVSLSDFEIFFTPPVQERNLSPPSKSKTLGAQCLAIISPANKHAIALTSTLGTENASHQKLQCNVFVRWLEWT